MKHRLQRQCRRVTAKMKTRSNLLAILIISFITVANTRTISHDNDNDEWSDFKRRYNKSYDNEVEEKFRKSVFHENQGKIAKHNEQYDVGNFSYKIKINQFGDMLFEEYKKYMHADNHTILIPKSIPLGKAFVKPKDGQEIPDFVDWRKRGAVTDVQDQGLTCGSCWAFSATGALEAQYFKKTGVLTALSVQNLIDCTEEYGNQGCAGGNAALSFQYVLDGNGLESADNYEYEGRTKECPYNVSLHESSEEVETPCYGYIDYADENALKMAVATIGPLSAAFDGSHDTFRFYSEGIYYQPEYKKVELDHAVLIIGYGTDSQNRDYWLVKNSWGETWGEAGYFKIARNKDNHCGIATAAIYPIV